MLVDITVHVSTLKDEEIRPLESKPSDIKDIIEDFLCTDKIPKLRSNPRLLNYFCQDPRHCLILFTFILNPDTYEVSENVNIFLLIDKLKTKYSFLSKYNISKNSVPPTPSDKSQARKSMKDQELMTAAKVSKMYEKSYLGVNTVKSSSKDDENSYCIYKAIRAFQTYMLLTDNANYLYLSSENKSFTEQFCILFSINILVLEILQSFKIGFHWNLTMTIKLMEYFILRQPKSAIKKILSLNIINFLVTMLHKPIIKNFFLLLMDPFDTFLNLHPDLKSILWKHAKNVKILI